MAMICPKCLDKGSKPGMFWQNQFCDCPAGDALRTRATANATQGVTPPSSPAAASMPVPPARDSLIILRCGPCEAFHKVAVESWDGRSVHLAVELKALWHRRVGCRPIVRASLLPGASPETIQALREAGLLPEVAVKADEPSKDEVDAVVARLLGVKG